MFLVRRAGLFVKALNTGIAVRPATCAQGEAMSEQIAGKILGIALRTGIRAPMKEVPRAVAVENGGLEGDLAGDPARGISLLAAKQWQEVVRSLGTVLLWHTRRANVLVDADTLQSLIGKTIRLGEMVEVIVTGEAEPCGLMDEIRPGLREALKADCRGGVLGRIIKGGTFAVGDRLTVRG
jgi:MOSC domain-containing protein YiiM